MPTDITCEAAPLNTRQPPQTGKLPFSPLTLWGRLKWLAVAAGCFHLAYEFALCAPLIIGFLYALFRLAHVPQRRDAMILGWIAGLFIYGPQLAFFWTIFDRAAIALWLVLGTWLSLYLMLQRFALLRLDAPWAGLAAPLLWTGLEYFRSELYYLRFSWLNIGYVFAPFPNTTLLRYAGMYGVGFLLMLLAASVPRWRLRRATFISCGVALAALAAVAARSGDARHSPEIKVAGVQLEFRRG